MDIINSILPWVITAVSGAFIWLALDSVIVLILGRFFPEKYILKIIKQIDDKYIDALKKKTPKAGKEVERRITELLSNLILIINDKK